MSAWDNRLLAIEKPARYTGGEVHAVRPSADARVRFALAFPDVYEVGMSHLGLQILYARLNALPGVSAERAYAPWPDMEVLLRGGNRALGTLESGRPLKDFDVVGFSLQYELSYTNVLTMLDLGGIPLHRTERRDDDPLVLAGGPCAFNPAPLSAFIDAFVIGEGEEAVEEIAAALLRLEGKPRREKLEALAALDGLVVPAFPAEKPVRKRIFTDLDASLEPLLPVTPLMKTIHDRITLEIARGCTRGCRFCQAGMVWRPVRERSAAAVSCMAEARLAATGQDEMSLLSLSSGDYSGIEPLLASLMDRYAARRIALALPSLRVETLTQRLIEDIRRVRKTSFTLAPEAGTQRLRDAINKGNTEADLLETAARIVDAGWQSLKLYFMIGLPGETEADVEGIAELAYKTLGAIRYRGQVTVSVSTFVPKSHTPLQWAEQIPPEETAARQAFFRGRLRHRKLQVKWHDRHMSLLEGVFARGGEEMGRLVETAWRLGCRFDGWAESFDYTRWEEAFRQTGLDPQACITARPLTATLPWDGVDCGLTPAFLDRERERYGQGVFTPDCRGGACAGCGACDFQTIRPTLATPLPEACPADAAVAAPARERRYRLSFTKTDGARFLAHIDIATTLQRALARCDIPVAFSEGFHPHPKLSFAFATAVGLESRGEYADLFTERPLDDIEEKRQALNACLPDGLQITALEEIPPDAPALSGIVQGFAYTIPLPDDATPEDLDRIDARASAFLAAETFVIDRPGKDKTTRKDIRPFVRDLRLDRETRTLSLEVAFSAQGTVKPLEILRHVLEMPAGPSGPPRILKCGTFFAASP